MIFDREAISILNLSEAAEALRYAATDAPAKDRRWFEACAEALTDEINRRRKVEVPK